MRLLSAGLSLLALSIVASASVLDDAKLFLLPSEDFVDVSKVQLGNSSLLVLRGSIDTLVVLDESSGDVLRGENVLRALQSIKFSLSPTQAKSFSSLASSFSENVISCANVYRDFASGAGSNCFETTYFRFQCSYLWDQGLWRGLLGFSIVDARREIEAALSKLNSSSQTLVKAAAAFEEGDFSAAGIASTAVAAAKPAANSFAVWHGKMLSYKPFATDGRLARCVLRADLLEGLLATVGTSLDTGTPEGKKAVGDRIAKAYERGLAKYYYARAIALLEDYSLRASSFNSDFAEVRSARAFFVLSDEESVREATGRINGSAEKASSGMAEFKARLAAANERLQAANNALGEYRRASQAINAAVISASNNSRKLISESSQAIAKKLFDLDTDFIVLEQEMRLHGNASKEDFIKLSKKVDDVQKELEQALLQSSSISSNLPSLSGLEIAGLLLLVAVGIVLSYQYYHSKHHY